MTPPPPDILGNSIFQQCVIGSPCTAPQALSPKPLRSWRRAFDPPSMGVAAIDASLSDPGPRPTTSGQTTGVLLAHSSFPCFIPLRPYAPTPLRHLRSLRSLRATAPCRRCKPVRGIPSLPARLAVGADDEVLIPPTTDVCVLHHDSSTVTTHPTHRHPPVEPAARAAPAAPAAPGSLPLLLERPHLDERSPPAPTPSDRRQAPRRPPGRRSPP